MIRSMTGFGKAEHKYPGGNIVVELKTVNHRYYELSSRMPPTILFLEDKIRSYINTKVKRGKASLSLAIEGNHILEKHLSVNNALAKKYFAALTGLKKELGLTSEVSLDHLISMPEVVTCRSSATNVDKIWPYVKAALDKALVQLIKTREIEGAALCKDMGVRIKAIEKIADEIKLLAPSVVKAYKENLNAKIIQISPSVKLDEGRLEQEVTMFAKNCDITEEITRLKAHIKSVECALSEGKEVGRQLDFIAQELFREINTTGAKAQDINISKLVIKAKEEIEKVREQVQNIE